MWMQNNLNMFWSNSFIQYMHALARSRSSLSANSMSEQKTNTTKEVSLFDHIKAPFFLGPVKYRNFQCFQKGDRGATSSSVNVSCTYDRMNYMSAIIPYHFHCWSISWAEMKSWPWKQAKCHSVAVRSVPTQDTFFFPDRLTRYIKHWTVRTKSHGILQ